MAENQENQGITRVETYRDLAIILSLILAALIVYWQVQYYELIDYDDISYIIRNRHVRAGLSWDGLIWAMTDIHTGYWHPLTWFSHMLDYELFRDNAGGHHWTSLIFHIANIILLYIFLKRATADVWKSAFVAALFAVHPLNVESVAWVAERKNVLSTFFWLMTMWAYICYTERPSWQRYALLVLAFAFGLMAKPMLVTLPCALILLDFWPLCRLNSWKTFFSLILEKIPLFVFSLVMSIFTFLATRHEGAVISLNTLSLESRIYHALVSYGRYLGKIFWPENLAVFYPYIKDYGLWHISGALLGLTVITFFAFFLARHYRYFLTGWFWYLGTLVPVIGFIQAGDQALADRYMYVPAIGVFIMVVWGSSDILRKWPKLNVAFAGTVILLLSICTFNQLRYWQNSLTLFGHAIEVTQRNALAHNNLGVALLNRGSSVDAEINFTNALKINPDYSAAHDNMGLVLAARGKLDDAVLQYQEALRIKPDDEKAYNNMGIAFARMGRLDEAIRCFAEAIKINPENADAYNNMGSAMAMRGEIEKSIQYFKKALQLDNDYAMAHNNVGLALANMGRLDEAVDHFKTALRINPDFKEAYQNLQTVIKKIKKTNK